MTRMTLIAVTLALLTGWSGTAQEQAAPAVFKPAGVYASSGWRDGYVRESELAQGVLVRARWSQLEPEPGVFDFSSIDEQRRAIVGAGKQWSLAVAAGPSTPAWLTQPPYSAPTIRVKARQRGKGYAPIDLPQGWDPVVVERLGALADALAERYNEDETLTLVYVPQMTANGIEGHFNANREADLRQAGLTGELYIKGAEATARAFASAFDQKALAIEVHEVLGDANIPATIINNLWNDPALGQRVGAAVWWLSGKQTYQRDLLGVLEQYPGDIYAQVIGRSDQPHRFPEAGYDAVFTQAQQLGVRYIEVWQHELREPARFTAIQRFNETAKAQDSEPDAAADQEPE